MLTENFVPHDEPSFADVSVPPGLDDERAFALQVEGTCMAPTCPEGAIVIVSPGTPIGDGKVVAVESRRRWWLRRAFINKLGGIDLRADHQTDGTDDPPAGGRKIYAVPYVWLIGGSGRSLL